MSSGRAGEGKLLWPLVALGIILLFNFLFTPGFFSVIIRDGHLYGTVVDIFDRASPIMLLALGMTLVIATGGIDLSVGAVTALSGAIVASKLQTASSPIATACLIALLVSVVCGLWNGILVAILKVQPIVATLVLMVAGRGIAQLVTDGTVLEIKATSFYFLGSGFFLGFPVTMTLVLLMLGLTALVTRKTAAGLFIEATGNSPVASRYAGIQASAVQLFVYTFSGFCASLAGLIIASDIHAADANNSGLYLELDAILAVVIGGTALTGGRFYLIGSLIGALIIQTITTTINTKGIAVEWTLVIKAGVVLVVCLLQSPTFRGRLKKLAKRLRRERKLVLEVKAS